MSVREGDTFVNSARDCIFTIIDLFDYGGELWANAELKEVRHLCTYEVHIPVSRLLDVKKFRIVPHVIEG